MDAVVSPYLLFASLALGGFGVALALPRPKVSPQVIGVLLAAVALGGAFLAIGLRAGAERPGFYFYLFSVIGLGAALRVISHPKPVYAALYFVLTILSSCALYLMLHAEFMAFALVIIYAGAILITYLFVIMLAEQAPSDEELGTMSPYDRFSREPAAATVVGFVLLAALTGMLARGIGAGELAAPPASAARQSLLSELPRKSIIALDHVGAFEGLARPELNQASALIDAERRLIRLVVATPDRFRASLERPDMAALVGSDDAVARARELDQGDSILLRLPADVRDENIEGVGFALIAGHPMALELAGVILLMAMLGAVVLARKQIEIGEEEKAEQAQRGRVNAGAPNGRA